MFPRTAAHPLRFLLRQGGQFFQPFQHAVSPFFRLVQETDILRHQFRDAAHRRSNHRHAPAHGLHDGDRHAFLLTGVQKHIESPLFVKFFYFFRVQIAQQFIKDVIL